MKPLAQRYKPNIWFLIFASAFFFFNLGKLNAEAKIFVQTSLSIDAFIDSNPYLKSISNSFIQPIKIDTNNHKRIKIKTEKTKHSYEFTYFLNQSLFWDNGSILKSKDFSLSWHQKDNKNCPKFEYISDNSFKIYCFKKNYTNNLKFIQNLKPIYSGSSPIPAGNPSLFMFKNDRLSKTIEIINKQTNKTEFTLKLGSISQSKNYDAIIYWDINKTLFQSKPVNKKNNYLAEAPLFEIIFINNSNPILSKPEIRKILISSLNPNLIKELTRFKNIEPINKITTISFKNKYNSDEIKKLLSKNGWTLDSRNQLTHPIFGKFELELLISNNYPHRYRMAKIIAGEWKKIGIKLNIELIGQKSFYELQLKRKKFNDLALVAVRVESFEELKKTLSSKYIPRYKNSWSGLNFSKFHDLKMDQLLSDKILSKKQLKNVESIIEEKTPFIPLFQHYYSIEYNTQDKQTKEFVEKLLASSSP